MARLGDVCEKRTSNIAQKDLEGHSGNYPIYGASGFIKNVDFYQQENPYIAVVKDGAGIGRIMKLPGKSSVIATMQYIIPNDTVDISYLAYAMEHMNLSKYFTGATIPHIYFKDYQREEFPLPSLAEQRKIAAVLDKVSDLIAKRRQQLTKLDELVKARFVEIFGDPTVNDKGWKMEKAEKHINLISGFPFDSRQYAECGVNICGGLIIMPQKINWNDCKHWSCVEGYEAYLLQENDIVIALDRPWISEGFKIALVDKEHLPALLIQRTARIRATDINQNYLMYCFLLGGFDIHCNITGSLVPHISLKDIRSFLIMLPPRELQDAFSSFIEITQQAIRNVCGSLKKMETLKKSLMQEYFGE